MTVTQGRPSRTARLASAWRSGPLSAPGFRLLMFGQFASTIGDYCYAVALPWLVLSGGGSAASLGVVLACYGIARAVLTVPGGSLADRFSPRLVMLSSDFARCALAAVFAVLAAAHVSSLAALAPVAALLGAFSALFMPASMTMMPSLVASGRLTAANAVYTGFVQAGSMLGPVIGGVLVASSGPTTAFAVDAGSYLVSAVTLAFISAAAPGRQRPARLPQKMTRPRGKRRSRRPARRRPPGRLRETSGSCCASPGSCRSSWWCRSPPTSRSSGPARWPSRRWRTRASVLTVTARC